MIRVACMIALWLLILFLPSVGSLAHESIPLYIEINQTDINRYKVRIKTPDILPSTNQPSLILPSDCNLSGPKALMVLECSKPLQGRDIGITYPAFRPSVSTLMRYDGLSGESYSNFMPPDIDVWHIPARQATLGVLSDYGSMGMRHIWAGADHLLFLVCLMLIAVRPKRIFMAVTGFTLGHSITLAAATLGLVVMHPLLVESLIALSVIFLAYELVRPNSENLIRRYPLLVSSLFGLLHGFGFAALLQNFGLPQMQKITGLIGFNLGVEVGQILFIIAAGTIVWLLYHISNIAQNWPQIERVSAYLVGITASYWLFDRLSGIIA